MSSPNTQASSRADPVLPDQGGRLLAVDPTSDTLLPEHEVIRRKAYELYLLRGKKNGHAVEDWLEAETLVRGTSPGKR